MEVSTVSKNFATMEETVAGFTLPKMKGYRLLVVPVKAREKTQGGILLPVDTVKSMTMSTPAGYVVAMGAAAYRNPDVFEFRTEGGGGTFMDERCKMGDVVIHHAHAGYALRLKNEAGEFLDCKIISDSDVLATVEDLDSLAAVGV